MMIRQCFRVQGRLSSGYPVPQLIPIRHTCCTPIPFPFTKDRLQRHKSMTKKTNNKQ